MHKGLLDKNRREINFHKAQVENVLPEYFVSSYPKFIALLNRYYQYEEQNESTELINHLFQSRDITETDLTLLSFIEDELLLGQNYFEGFPNKRASANFSSNLFRAKGSRYSIQWFFRSFYNLDPEVLFTKQNVFKLNDGNSKLGVESVKYLTDDKLYQTYALLVKIGVPIKEWRELFKLFVHPAGMYLGGEVLLLSLVDLNLNTNQPDPGVANHYPWGSGKTQTSGAAKTKAIGEQIIYYEQQPTYILGGTNSNEGTVVSFNVNAINADDGPIYFYLENQTSNYDDFKNPTSDPAVYIQLESSGLDDTGIQYKRQRIVVGGYGGTEVLNQDATRGWFVTRMVPNGNSYSYHSSNQYDTYDAVDGLTNANNLLTYLQTFNVNDLLIINTFDEPAKNKGVFESELINQFSANAMGSAAWSAQPDPVRCRYQLVSIKGSGAPLHEDIDFPGQTDIMAATLLLESQSPYDWKVLNEEYRYEPQYLLPTNTNRKQINIVNSVAEYNEIEIRSDLKTEGPETFKAYLYDELNGGEELDSLVLVINDTSITVSGPSYNIIPVPSTSPMIEGNDLQFKIVPTNPTGEVVNWEILGQDVVDRFPTATGSIAVPNNVTINVPSIIDPFKRGIVSGTIQVEGGTSGTSSQVTFQMNDVGPSYTIEFENNDNQIVEGESLRFKVNSQNCDDTSVTVAITDNSFGDLVARIDSYPNSIIGLDANLGNTTSALQTITTTADTEVTNGIQIGTITVTGVPSGATASADFFVSDLNIVDPVTYQVSGDQVLSEPSSGTSDHSYTLTTENLGSGTFYWSVDGYGNNPTVAEDWSDGYVDNATTVLLNGDKLRGRVNVTNNTGSFIIRQASNPALEGDKKFQIRIYDDNQYSNLVHLDSTIRTVTEELGTVILPDSISIESSDSRLSNTTVVQLRFYSDGTATKYEETDGTFSTSALSDWHDPSGDEPGINYDIQINGSPNNSHTLQYSINNGTSWNSYTTDNKISMTSNVWFRWTDDDDGGLLNQSNHVVKITDKLTNTPQDTTILTVKTTDGLQLKTRLANMWLSDMPSYSADHGQSISATQPLRNDLISRHCFNLDSFITGNLGADGWEFRPFNLWSLNGVNTTNFPEATGGSLNPNSGDEIKGNGINGNRTQAGPRTLTLKNKTDARKEAAQLTNFVTIVYANAANDGGYADFVYNLVINGYSLRTSSDVTDPNVYQWTVKRNGLIGGRFGYLQVEIPYTDLSTINATMTFGNDDVATIQEIYVIPGRYDATFVSKSSSASGSANLCSISGGEKDDLVLSWGMAEEDNGTGISPEGPGAGDPNIAFSNNMTRIMGRGVYRNDYVQSNMFVVTSDGTVTYSLQQNSNPTQTAMMLLKFAGNEIIGAFDPSDPVGSFGKYVANQGDGDGSTGCPDPDMQIQIDADGTTVRAGDLKVGDVVYTYHEHTLQEGLYTVTHAKPSQQPKVKFSFEDGVTVIVSDTHQFKGIREFVVANTLSIGDEVFGKTISDIEYLGTGTVIKLEIEDAHTYIVNGILSHNKLDVPTYEPETDAQVNA